MLAAMQASEELEKQTRKHASLLFACKKQEASKGTNRKLTHALQDGQICVKKITRELSFTSAFFVSIFPPHTFPFINKDLIGS